MDNALLRCALQVDATIDALRRLTDVLCGELPSVADRPHTAGGAPVPPHRRAPAAVPPVVAIPPVVPVRDALPRVA